MDDSEETRPPLRMPDRIAIDAKGYGWRVWDGDEMWSMVPVNPDNSPIPLPVTWFIPVPAEVQAAVAEGRDFARINGKWVVADG